MIQHHEGALQMVKDLLATPGAGQDVDVNVFANDVVTRPDRRDRRHAPDALPAARQVSPLPRHPEPSRCPSLRRVFALVAPLVVIPSLLAAQTYPSGQDPRSGLKPGRLDAGVAAKNMRLVSFSPKPAAVRHGARPDVHQFRPRLRRQVRLPGQLRRIHGVGRERLRAPKPVAVVSCITVAGRPVDRREPAVHLRRGRAAIATTARKGGVQDPKDHMAGVRIYDVSNPAHAAAHQERADLQGIAHAHGRSEIRRTRASSTSTSRAIRARARTVSSPVARTATDPADTTNSLYRLDVIKVPLAHPEQAAVVTGARIFTGLDRPRHGPPAGPTVAPSRPVRRPESPPPPPPPTGPRNCHDVTAYPAMHLLAGACASYGLLVDISNPEKPVRLDARADTNFSLWHTAVFSNDGKKVVFTDEWGGGTGPMCQADVHDGDGRQHHPHHRRRSKKYTQHAYFKIPTAQTAAGELRLAQRRPHSGAGSRHHGAGLVPGRRERDGLHGPRSSGELAYFDRGPIDPPPPADYRAAAARRSAGGAAPARHDRRLVGRVLLEWHDLLVRARPRLRHPRAAAERPALGERDRGGEAGAPRRSTIRRASRRSCGRRRSRWCASYLDQLVRDNGLAAARTTAIARALDAAEKQSGRPRRTALHALAAAVDQDAAGARDPKRVKAMSAAITQLAQAGK